MSSASAPLASSARSHSFEHRAQAPPLMLLVYATVWKQLEKHWDESLVSRAEAIPRQHNNDAHRHAGTRREAQHQHAQLKQDCGTACESQLQNTMSLSLCTVTHPFESLSTRVRQEGAPR